MAGQGPASDVELALQTLKQRDYEHGKHLLREAVGAAAKELSLEKFANFEDMLFRRMFSMVRSTDFSERRGAVAGMEALIDVASGSVETKIIKFANTFKGMIKTNTDGSLLADIARALGHLARASAAPNNDFVEFELNRALEWLLADAQYNHRRLAACLVLRQLALNTPTLFFAKRSDFFERIWPVLLDSKQDTRDAAAQALSAGLAVLAQRPSPKHVHCYFKNYEHMQASFERGNSDAVHGALLAVGAMLQHSGDFMVPRFDPMCDAVLNVREHPNRLLRLTVIRTLPHLAVFGPDAFARTYLKTTVAHLVKAARPVSSHQDLRAAALLALGDLALAMEDHLLAQDLTTLVALVRESMSNDRRAPFCPEVFKCASNLVEALREHISPEIISLLDPMLGTGLSKALIATLITIARVLPEHKALIQQRLLQELTTVLSGHSYLAPGMSLNAQSTASSGLSYRKGRSIPTDGNSLDAVLISLKTLASFQMDDVCLLPFVRNCLLQYLDHKSLYVRQKAVVASCRLLVNPSTGQQVALRGPSARMIQEVLQRLLQVALADPERTVRQTLLDEIKPHFDCFLRQPVHLETLFLFLSDEDLHIRIETVKLFGRLAVLNPGFVLPPLRQTLMRLIAELQLQSDTNTKEHAARLLSEFLRAEALHRLVRPFMQTIVEALPLRGRTRLATVALEALGELCLVMGEEMIPYFQQLMPVILENIQDQSSTLKREVSLRTLGRLVSSTGYVVKPYLQYSDLLPRILSVLREGGNQPWSLRTEILRTIGLLGALDPYRYEALQTYNASRHTSTQRLGAITETLNKRNPVVATHDGQATYSSSLPSPGGSAGILGATTDAHLRLIDQGYADVPAHTIMFEQSAMVAQPCTGILEQESSRLTPACEDYNPKVAISALMRILQDQSLYPYHYMVMNAVMLIFQSLGLRCVPFLAEIIPHMLHVVQNCEPGMRESLLLQLAGLTRIVKVHLHMFLPHIFDLVCEYWDDHTEQVLVLVEEMAVSVREKFRPFVPRLIPLLLKSMVLPRVTASGAAAPQQPSNSSGAAGVGVSSSTLGNLQSSGAVTLKLVLRSIAVLQPVLGDNLHLLVPGLIKLVDQMNELGHSVRVAGLADWQLRTVTALATLCQDSSLVHSMGFAARITRSLVKLLDKDGNSGVLQNAIMATFTIVARQLGPQFVHLHTLVKQAMLRRSITYPAFDESIARLGRGSLQVGSSLGVDGRECTHTTTTSSQDLAFGLDELGVDCAAIFPRDLPGVDQETLNNDTTAVGGPGYRLPMNRHHLQNAWDVSQRSTAEDWNEWIQRFTVELLRESPSPALRACNALARVHSSLARELFHAAFVSCWFELPDDYQANLVMSLGKAFQSDSIPPEILQTLLNLAEFMEHDAEALPIDIRALADLAQTCHAHAKALHYKEIVFQTSPATCVDALISINKKLDQPEAAQGILKYAQKQNTLYGTQTDLVTSVKESWLAKLGNWEEALVLYRRRFHTRDRDVDAVLGCMKCLDALGHWQEVVDLCFKTWDSLHAPTTAAKVRKKAAALSATAAWNLGQWENMEKLVTVMEPEEMVVEGPFFRAVLAVHKGRFEECANHIDRARKLLHNTYSALVSESYKRAYTSMVSVQQLAEIEEVVEYKRVEMDPARADEAFTLRQRLKDKWQRRLKGCRLEVSAWQRVLKVRSLVLSPAENVDSWLQFASLCRQSGNFPLSERILTHHLSSVGAAVDTEGSALGYGPQTMPLNIESTCIQHRVQYAYYKHLWAVGGRQEDALKGMSELANRLSNYQRESNVKKLLVKSLLKCGDWRLARVSTNQGLNPRILQAVLESYKSAKDLDNDSYKGWHAWAMINFRMMENYMKKTGRSSSFGATQPRPTGIGGASHQLVEHAVAAAIGFLRAVSLGRKRWSGSVQQDLLNLLNVLFWYGHLPDLERVLARGFQTVCLDAWLGVLPQLIARINTENETVRTMLHDLLTSLGSRHPQALVYPLSVALKSHSTERKAAAEELLRVLHAHSQQLVEQARQVSLELIRVAILWHELWHEGLEEASRLYFGDGNIRGMLDTLLPLHELLNEGAKTHREVSFQSTFGRELRDAQLLLEKYQRAVAETGGSIPTGGGFRGNMPGNSSSGRQRQVQPNDPEGNLNSAWDLYYNVFRRINKQLPQLTNLDLQYVSPYLLNARQLELAVPGTYRVDRTAVRIQTFGPTVQVITSKQRPRKITMYGEDGHDYVFLLKGHEDLRQDERAMQLFGLVNALLESDRRTNKNDLSIQRYAVTPLSHNAGVVGWVPNTDTLHALIRDYRESRKILLNIEHRLMVQMAPDYDMLSLMQKLEVFEAALENTAGQDLYRVLWLKSNDSEQWLDRRTCYTRSLAVMSMVGYILGLGDRHPSNLMLDRNTGKILHIDFGDCFEVAMHRDKFPEKIPFRLTRMMVNAMEVSGIEGNYRSTCDYVMSVLRDNRDSLLAMLQAFVHDPLISWRLLGTQQRAGSASTPAKTLKPTPPNATEAKSGSRSNTIINAGQLGPSTTKSMDKRGPSMPGHDIASPNPGSVMLPIVAGQFDRAPSLRLNATEQSVAAEKSLSGKSHQSGSDRGDGTDENNVVNDGNEDVLTTESGKDSHVLKRDEDAPSISISEAITRPDNLQNSSCNEADGGAKSTLAANGDVKDGYGDMRIAQLENSSSIVDARFASIQNLAQSLRNQSSTRMPHETASLVGGSMMPSVRDTYRSTRERELGRFLGPEGIDASRQALNEKALTVIRRVQDKLTGQDFSKRGASHPDRAAYDVASQVEMLISQATSNERLCQSFVGWCPFW